MSIVDDTTPFNRIFNYLLNYKNCEAEDLSYTNLYVARVKGKETGVEFEDIRDKFYNTGYAAIMKTPTPTTP